MDEAHARWAGGTSFAEEAEAIGVPTACVLAVKQNKDGEEAVLFTHVATDAAEAQVYACGLARDYDGIYRVVTDVDPFMTLGELEKGVTE